ncbi:MAG: haloalkane dehalogenase [Pseudomonadota bacterium]
MNYLRTPDERFEQLADFPFKPNYLHVDDGEGGRLRVHYIDEGDRETAPVLLLHGEPSWSYLYRHMIPPLVEAGHRVIAPDLIGFGRSDKPSRQSDYSYARHTQWLASTIAQLGLNDITLFCQDWGGLLGLRLVGRQPERYARVIAANTFLPTGDEPIGEAFEQWRAFSQSVPEFPVGQILNKATVRELSSQEIAAYDAPFPDESFKAGARKFPLLVPTTPEAEGAQENRAAWEGLARFEKPFLTAFGDSDPITRGAERLLQQRIPGAVGQTHVIVEQAGHFLQEDQGLKLAQIINDLIENSDPV